MFISFTGTCAEGEVFTIPAPRRLALAALAAAAGVSASGSAGSLTSCSSSVAFEMDLGFGLGFAVLRWMLFAGATGVGDSAMSVSSASSIGASEAAGDLGAGLRLPSRMSYTLGVRTLASFVRGW
jgi:hypothetical protein